MISECNHTAGKSTCFNCAMANDRKRLEAENAKLREALLEICIPPYEDSDLKSFLEWQRARAAAVLGEKS